MCRSHDARRSLICFGLALRTERFGLCANRLRLGVSCHRTLSVQFFGCSTNIVGFGLSFGNPVRCSSPRLVEHAGGVLAELCCQRFLVELCGGYSRGRFGHIGQRSLRGL